MAGFILPMLSNDVWAVLAHASVAAQGHDIYASAEALPGSVWFSWVGDRAVLAKPDLRPDDDGILKNVVVEGRVGG